MAGKATGPERHDRTTKRIQEEYENQENTHKRTRTTRRHEQEENMLTDVEEDYVDRNK